MKKMRYDICHDKWRFTVMSQDDFIRKHKTDDEAMATFESYEVDIQEAHLTVETIKHELVHVHLNYCFLESASGLSKADLEEIYCELFARRSDLISKQAKEIFKKLKG